METTQFAMTHSNKLTLGVLDGERMVEQMDVSEILV